MHTGVVPVWVVNVWRTKIRHESTEQPVEEKRAVQLTTVNNSEHFTYSRHAVELEQCDLKIYGFCHVSTNGEYWVFNRFLMHAQCSHIVFLAFTWMVKFWKEKKSMSFGRSLKYVLFLEIVVYVCFCHLHSFQCGMDVFCLTCFKMKDTTNNRC